MKTGMLLITLGIAIFNIASANMVKNADFSEVREGKLAEWKVGELNPPAEIPLDGIITTPKGAVISVKETGDVKALHIEENGTTDGGDFALVMSSRIPVIPGFSYGASVSYRAKGLMPESSDRKNYTAIFIDIFFENAKGRVGSVRIKTMNNSRDWIRLTKTFPDNKDTFVIPNGAQWAVMRIQLVNKYKDNKVIALFNEVTMKASDATLPNASFEEGDTAPKAWKVTGASKTVWTENARSGKRSLLVADAGDGLFSGWTTEVPARSDRAYSFGGYIKGGDLKSDGLTPGGVFVLQFINADGNIIGDTVVSPAVEANTDWKKTETMKTSAPYNAAKMRLTLGLKYSRGSAWFDDVFLNYSEVESASMRKVRREAIKPSDGVAYAKNLLANGMIEEGSGEKPAGWTFIGKPDPDWTKDEIEQLYTEGRPKFSIGRAKGEWSRDQTYEGKGALVLISVDPALSPRRQWYGRNPIDGYWLSDAMPCKTGRSYLASAWLKPGVPIESPWYGPLEIQFFDNSGKQIKAANDPRSGIGTAEAGAWIYWATRPWTAPTNAVSLRLRFGQELSADSGGWGRSIADNFAVWELPVGAAVPSEKDLPSLNAEGFHAWFAQAHKKIKPPYLPSPKKTAEYESVWGRSVNNVSGNCFTDPTKPVELAFTFFNVLGEDRMLSLSFTSYDWLGETNATITTPPIAVKGYSSVTVKVTVPATNKFGAFYVKADMHDAEAVVGSFSGRYAVLPPLTRPHTAENPWGVTYYDENYGGSAYKTELGAMLKTAGFGIAWVRMKYDPSNEDDLLVHITETKKVIEWYRSLGIKCILQLLPGNSIRPIVPEPYVNAGKAIAAAFKGEVLAYGNWSIEEANHSAYYRKIPRGASRERMTDGEYDTILAAQYDGIKSVASDATVLIGNIATDWEAKTIKRLYNAPAKGKFDGAILNAYMGLLITVQNSIKEFDKHGDTNKVLYQEETADQRSPFKGEERRYGEIEGAANMVRVWTSLFGRCYPRLKSMTMWGFTARAEQDILMVTPGLQPRPHFVAHAVMADALADASFIAERSSGEVIILEWKRGDGELYELWANSGERTVTFETKSASLTVMDIMGNETMHPAQNGLVTLTVTTTPVYVIKSGPISISTRVGKRAYLL